MQIAPATGIPVGIQQTPSSQAGQEAANAFGLSFESLLRIILAQLTYQDPLRPMENFEFVSQLAQFSQIQIGQTGNERLQALVAAQGSVQAIGLLGRLVDIPAGAATLSGEVVSIAFSDGAPRLTIRTSDGQTISDLTLGSVSQIREGEQ